MKTSDAKTARELVTFERLKEEARFKQHRAKLRPDSKSPLVIPSLSKSEQRDLAFRWFIQLEEESERWRTEEARKLEPNQINEIVSDLGVDVVALSGGSSEGRFGIESDDGAWALRQFLAQENLSLPEDSETFLSLRELFRRALVENKQRTLERIDNKHTAASDAYFKDVSAYTLPPAKPVSLGELLDRHQQWLIEARRSLKTQSTYETPKNLLRDLFGNSKPADHFTREEIREAVGLLRRMPSNAKKRYPGFSLVDAIAEADRRGDIRRLAPKSLKNYYRNLFALFRWGVDESILRENPLKGRNIRELFEFEEEEKEKVVFSVPQLKELFDAPLYAGCVDDQRGYNRKGDQRPRKGRFWSPLIGLFHGFRSNEVTQLNTEDIKEEDGLLYFFIRRRTEDNTEDEKRTKNIGSKRKVPVHRELLRIGFAEFVNQRRGDFKNRRLFPELTRGKRGYVSDPFGKWFGRFVKKTLGEECHATFHSFRHMFVSALREADVLLEHREALGGWHPRGRSAEKLYGKPISLRRLHEEISKVQYPGLKLDHLYKR
ncbi:MAG: site-specific integrase [Verrucomicrobiota bacterium]|nr:site-specific integrase [Verrucomicrobiota bacterium]